MKILMQKGGNKCSLRDAAGTLFLDPNYSCIKDEKRYAVQECDATKMIGVTVADNKK